MDPAPGRPRGRRQDVHERLVLAPGDEAIVTALRALTFRSEVGASAWNGIAVVRLVAANDAVLRADLTAVLRAIRPLPRLWLN